MNSLLVDYLHGGKREQVLSNCILIEILTSVLSRLRKLPGRYLHKYHKTGEFLYCFVWSDWQLMAKL